MERGLFEALSLSPSVSLSVSPFLSLSPSISLPLFLTACLCLSLLPYLLLSPFWPDSVCPGHVYRGTKFSFRVASSMALPAFSLLPLQACRSCKLQELILSLSISPQSAEVRLHGLVPALSKRAPCRPQPLSCLIVT